MEIERNKGHCTVPAEYGRIKALFADADENQLALLDGAIVEAARLRVELDQLYEQSRLTGLLKTDPANPFRQKELPVSKMLPKVRANYANIIFKLAAILGKNMSEDELGLDEYE